MLFRLHSIQTTQEAPWFYALLAELMAVLIGLLATVLPARHASPCMFNRLDDITAPSEMEWELPAYKPDDSEYVKNLLDELEKE